MTSIKMSRVHSARPELGRSTYRPSARHVACAAVPERPSGGASRIPESGDASSARESAAPIRTGGAGGASRDVNFTSPDTAIPTRTGGAGGASRDVCFAGAQTSNGSESAPVQMPPSSRPSGGAGRASMPAPVPSTPSGSVVVDRPAGGAQRMVLSSTDDGGDDGSSNNGNGGNGGNGGDSGSDGSGAGLNPIALLFVLGVSVFVCLEVNKRFNASSDAAAPAAPAKEEEPVKPCCSGKKKK